MLRTRYFVCVIAVSLIGLFIYRRLPTQIAQRTTCPDDLLSRSSLVKNGTFWSDIAETLVPKGISDAQAKEIIKTYRYSVVTSVRQRAYDVKRSRKQLFAVITYDDGTVFFVKYRPSSTYGEAIYYYFTRFLHMDNVPPLFLTKINKDSHIWKELNLTNLHWKDDQIIAMVYWIYNTNHATNLPHLLSHAIEVGVPVTGRSLTTSNLMDSSPTYISNMIQFGSMVIIDYIVMHDNRYKRIEDILDRLEANDTRYSNFEGRVKINTLRTKDGKVWSIDNESAFHCLQYRSPICTQKEKLYDRLLKSLCVFQSSLIASLKTFSEQKSLRGAILNYYKDEEPLLLDLERLQKNTLEKNIRRRLQVVLRWVKYCQKDASNNQSSDMALTPFASISK